MKTRLGIQIRALTRADWLALLILIILGAIGLSLVTPRFGSTYNFYVLLRNVSVTVVVGLSQMVVLAVGELNLSVGALGGFVTGGLGLMMGVWHLPLPLAILLALVIGSLAGLINGLLIVTSRIHGFIITIATASAFPRMSLGLTQAIPLYQLPASFPRFGQAPFGPIPYVLLLPVLLSPVRPGFV